MRIAVMGAGAIGGFFGARLARAGETVAFIARGEHLRAIQAGGLHIRSVEGDFTARAPATDAPGRVPGLIGPVELVLFCEPDSDPGRAGRCPDRSEQRRDQG